MNGHWKIFTIISSVCLVLSVCSLYWWEKNRHAPGLAEMISLRQIVSVIVVLCITTLIGLLKLYKNR